MENLGVIEWCIIGLVILVKIGIIISVIRWAKSNRAKKKQQLADEQRKMSERDSETHSM